MRRFPLGTILLLIAAVVLYAGMMGSIADSQHSDAAGRGLAAAFSAIFATLLLIDLAILLIVGAVKGRMSVAGKVGCFLVLPASLLAMWMAADAYTNRDNSAIWVLALMPLALTLYALRARFDRLRGLMRDVAADGAMAVVIVVLIGVPLARALFPPPRDPVAEAQAEAQDKARQAREEKAASEASERERAQFAALGPQSSMADYLPFLHGNHSRQAREGIARVKSRQADTVVLLGAGKLRELEGLLEYDINATPEVCAAYGAALARETAKVDPKANSNYLGVAIDLEAQRPNLEWLTGDGCDLKATLAQLEKNLRAVADSSRITKFADEIAKLQTK